MKLLQPRLDHQSQINNLTLDALERAKSTIDKAVEASEQTTKLTIKLLPDINFLMSLLPTIIFKEQTPINYAQEGKEQSRSSIIIANNGDISCGSIKLGINQQTSKHAKLLCLLNINKSCLVTNERIIAYIGHINITQAFKDLKKVIKAHGLKLDYERPRGQGIMLFGITKILI
jgi:4-hydroxy-L-threonine phosphate dehydrogenase PdxA